MSGSNQKSKRAVMYCVILFLIALIPMFIGDRMASINMIDFMQVMAAGVVLGVMITVIGHHLHSTTKQTA